MNLHFNTSLQGGKYKITSILGQGGFGITYLGLQTGLNRKVAIKEFFMKEYCNRNTDTSHVSIGSEGSRDLVDRFRQKFIKEAQNIAQLDHPNIVRIHDIFEENGTAYYVMEYIEGGSLQQYIHSQGKLSEVESLHYIREIASALEYIHLRQMNHLDVKPSNVLRRENGHVVLIDFGLSKRYDEAGSQTSSTPVGVSAGYAPIEQYNQGGVNTFSATTDIYSLGATLYKMLTSETPPNANQVFDEGLPQLSSNISANVRRAIEQAMQPKRKDRPQSICAFLSLLDNDETVIPLADSFDIDNEETVVNIGQNDDPVISHATSSSHSSPVANIAKHNKSRLPLYLLICALLVVAGFWLSRSSEDEWEYYNSNSGQSTMSVSSSKPISSTPTDDIKNNYNFDLNKGIAFYHKNQYAMAKRYFTDMLKEYPSYASNTKVWIKNCDSAITKEIDSNNAAERKMEEVHKEQITVEAERKKREEDERRNHDVISTSREVDLGLSVKWAGYNVGASSPEGYGNMYEGVFYDKSREVPKNIENISGTKHDIALNNWGSSWRMPTIAEFKELESKCKWEWVTYKGVYGYKVTGPNGNSIFFPATGVKSSKYVKDRGVVGGYWSGNLNINNDRIYYFGFTSAFRSSSAIASRNDEKAVRPVSY